MAWSPLAYSKVHGVETPPEGSDDPLLESAVSKTPRKRHCSGFWKVLLSILSLSAAAFFGAYCQRTWGAQGNNTLIRQVSQYGPLIKDVPITFEVHTFNGTFLPEGNPFRGPAGPETDAAWASLGPDYKAITVPETEAAASGLTKDHVSINPKYGGGYPANVEGLHHLHCLNLLRKSNHWNFEYYKQMGMGPFANSDYILEAHVTHCLDTIRQQLMCQVDIGVLGQVWMKGDDGPEPFVDFNTKHKCRNFDAVRSWAEERQAAQIEDLPDDYFMPPAGHVYDSTP